MARINMGDFGNVVANPGPVVQSDPNAYGAGIGRAVDRAGQIGMAEVQQDINQQQGEFRQQQRQDEADARQRQRQAEAEAKAAAREARRVKALTATAQVKNSLFDTFTEIEQGIADGTLEKGRATAEYEKRSAKILQDGLQGVDPEHQELARATLLEPVGAGRRGVVKLVVERDKADIRAGGMAYIEEMQRYAMRGPGQADEAIKNVRTFWQATGPQAGETPAQAQQRVQQFAERVRYQQATALVNADPGAALKALKNQDYLPELDPQQRTALIQTADIRVTQSAQRAEVAARAYERRLERDWTAVQTVLDAGKALAPEYAAGVLQKFKGTSYEGALRQLMAEGPANAAFVGQPLATQQRMLEEAQANMNRGGATPEQIKAYRKLETAHKAAQADVKADPYMAAAERGVITELSQLQLTDLQSLPQQLARRAQDAGQVSQWVGGEVSLFRPGEAQKVGEVLAALPPKDRAGAIAGLSKVMTPGQMRAFGQQLGSKDETLAAAAILSAQGAKTTSGRLVSELVLTGADAMKENRIKWPSGQDQTMVRQEIDQLTRGAFRSEDAQRAAGDAALAAFAGLLAEGKSPDVAQAVRLVTGGVMEMNGSRIVKPYGWTDGMVRKALRDYDEPRVTALTGGQPARWGDKELPPAELARLMPGAQLGTSGRPGTYTISIGGRMVLGADGRPLLVPLEQR